MALNLTDDLGILKSPAKTNISPGTNKLNLSDDIGIFGKPQPQIRAARPDESLIPQISRAKSKSKELKQKDPAETFIKETTKGVARGLEGIGSSAGNVIRMAGENLYEEGMRRGEINFDPSAEIKNFKRDTMAKFLIAAGNVLKGQGKLISDFWKNQQQTGIEAPDPQVFAGTFMQNPSWTRGAAIVTESVPSLALATAVTFATKNPTAGAAALGVIQGADVGVQAIEAGVPIGKANFAFAASTVGNTVLEQIPLTRFLRGGGPGKGIAKLSKDVFVGSMQEGGEEIAQRLWDNLIVKLGWDDTKALTEGLVESFIGGAGSGGILGGITSGRGVELDDIIARAKDAGVTDQEINAAIDIVAKEITAQGPKIEPVLYQAAQEEIEKKVVNPSAPDVMEHIDTSEKVRAGISASKDLVSMTEAAAFGALWITKEKNVSNEAKILNMNGLIEGMTNKAQEFGVDPDSAAQQARSFIYDNLIMATGDSDSARAWNQLFSSDEIHNKYFDALAENIRVLRNVQQMPPIAAAVVPEGSAVASGAPQPPSPAATSTPIEPAAPIIDEINAQSKQDIAKKPVSGGDAEEEVQGAKRMDAGGVPMSMNPDTDKTINKTEILTWVEKKFKIPIRGKATTRMTQLTGAYHTKAELMRLKQWGDLWSMTHELAHHIDKKMKQSLGRYWRKGATPESKRAIVKELCDLDYDQSKRRTSEGFAEFMRYYLTTDQAETKAPGFYKFFTREFLPNDKDLAAKLKTLRGMLDTWKQQGAENRIIEQIDFTQEHTRPGDLGQKIKAGIEKAWTWINKNFNDEFYTIEDIEKQMGIKRRENIRPTQDPYEMATYYKSKAGVIARTFVMEKAIDEYGRVLGPGLSEILKPIKSEDMQRFIAYGSAKRALELSKRNIDSGFDLDDAKYIVDKYKNEVWDKAVDDITVWANHLLDWVIRAGGLGQEEAEIIRKMNPIYLPFKRAFVDELGVVKGVGTGLVNKGQAVKKIKGSGRPIINPIESLVAQANEMILKAQKINIARLIAEQASKEGVGGFITKVPAPIEARTYTLEQLKSGLDAMGVDIGDADLDQVMTVFTQGWQYRGKDNIVSIWRNGKREFYEIHPELYRALCGLENLQRGVLLKILGPFSRILRLGATGIKVSFGLIRNPWRDALSYAVLSKHKTAIPVVDTVTGVIKEVTAKPGDLAWRFKNAGGSMSGMMGYDRAATMAAYDDLVNEKLKASKKVIRTVQHPINALCFALDKFRGALNISELGPRIAELEKSYNQYRKIHPDWNEEDCFVAAFNDAQDVTINFTKSGYLGKRINEAVAFFNANLRGFEKTWRSVKENPIRFFIKGLAWLTVFTVLNWFRNRDKEWYKNLPPAYRYGNVFIEVDDQTIIRLPIPFEVGMIFMSAPAAALDSLEAQDPKYIASLVELGKKQSPNIMPSALQPIWDVGRNKNYYGSDIEDKGMEYLPKGERKRSNTSKLAIGIAQGLKGLGVEALSPVQIEYLMQQYSGGAIRQIPQGKIKEPSDAPVLSDVLLDIPDRPRRQLEEFYDEWNNLKYKHQTRSLQKGDLSRLTRLKTVENYIKIYRKQAKQLEDAGKIKARDYIFDKMRRVLEKAGY